MNFFLFFILLSGILALYFILNTKINKLLESGEILSKVKSELSIIISEMDRTTDRNLTLLEEKIRSLDQYMQEADKRIRLIKKEVEESRRDVQTYNHLVSDSVIRKPVQKEEAVRLESKNEETDLLPLFSQPKETSAAPSSPENDEPKLSVQERAIHYADYGMDAKQIASKLNVTVGEVELILSINRAKAERKRK